MAGYSPRGPKESYMAERLTHSLSLTYKLLYIRICPGALVVKNLPANAGEVRHVVSIPGSGRSFGGGHGNSFQQFCLENFMDRGAWQAIALRVTQRHRIGHN